MWTCVSERRLRLESGAFILLLLVAGIVFSFVQKRGWLIGGAIAFPKLLWLAYALLGWFLSPFLVARDGRASDSVRRLYRVFVWNMAIRGIVELLMIYGWRNWHPYYGIAHDVFSIGLLLWLAAAAKPRTRLDRLLTLHGLVLAAMFIAEISFALYFSLNFVTRGGKALYFVPDEQRYSAILLNTKIAVSCLTLYFPWFFYRWLAASPDESRHNPGIRPIGS